MAGTTGRLRQHCADIGYYEYPSGGGTPGPVGSMGPDVP